MRIIHRKFGNLFMVFQNLAFAVNIGTAEKLRQEFPCDMGHSDTSGSVFRLYCTGVVPDEMAGIIMLYNKSL